MNYSIVVCCVFLGFQTVLGQDFEIYVDLVNLIQERGYPVQNYTVQTDDGYLLALYRIPHGIETNETNEKVVLLNHGLTGTAGDFLVPSPEKSLPFLLADDGYDVWLMNSRGNTYSNRHISIDESDKGAFYNFSWHQIGYYDIPANIDFILQTTQRNNLQFVGHSQGCTSFLVMASTRKEYNNKIQLATLLAPASFMNHVNSFLQNIVQYYDYFVQIPELINLYDIPMIEVVRAAIQIICKEEKHYEYCLNYIGYANHPQADPDTVRSVFKVFPSNIALKQPIHFAQSIRSGKFAQYDFGANNQEVYHSDTPPDYDLGKITCPISLFAGKTDDLVPPEDATTLSTKLKNLVNFKIIEDANGLWNHADFIWAKDIVQYQYDDMLNIMEAYNSTDLPPTNPPDPDSTSVTDSPRTDDSTTTESLSTSSMVDSTTTESLSTSSMVTDGITSDKTVTDPEETDDNSHGISNFNGCNYSLQCLYSLLIMTIIWLEL